MADSSKNENEITIETLPKVRSLLENSSTPAEIKKSILNNLSSFLHLQEKHIPLLLKEGFINTLTSLIKESTNLKISAFAVSLLVFISFDGEERKDGIDKDDQIMLVNISMASLINLLKKADNKLTVELIKLISNLLTPKTGTSSKEKEKEIEIEGLQPDLALQLIIKMNLILSSKNETPEKKLDILAKISRLGKMGVFVRIAQLSFSKESRPDLVSSPSLEKKFVETVNELIKILETLEKEDEDEVLTTFVENRLKALRDHSFFIPHKKSYSGEEKIVFLPNPAVGTNIIINGNKINCPQGSSYHSIFLDREITEGIYRIEFLTTGKHDNYGPFFGLALKNVIPQLLSSNLAVHGGACMIYNSGIHSGGSLAASHNNDFTNNGVIVLELNMAEKALFFWVNGVLIPHTITNIPTTGVFFGISLFKDVVVEVKSFKKLNTPTTTLSNLGCTQHSWR